MIEDPGMAGYPLVCQRKKKLNQIIHFFFGQPRELFPDALLASPMSEIEIGRIGKAERRGSVAACRIVAERAAPVPASVVKSYHVFQRRLTSIVEIRRGEADISQRGRLESAVDRVVRRRRGSGPTAAVAIGKDLCRKCARIGFKKIGGFLVLPQ